MTQRDKDEFLFECDEHGHSHDDGDEDDVRELVLTTTYLAEHQVFEMNLITGALHFSEDFISQLKGAYESPHPVAALHIKTMDDNKNIMMIDESQAIDLVTLLLEWVTRLNNEEGGRG